MTGAERVRRYWESFWSAGDPSAVAEFYAPSFRLNARDVSRDEWLKEAVTW